MAATALQGLSFGIWGVIFYLYLNLQEVGFQPDFIGNMFTVGAIATGIIALPAGLICERLGSKKTILISFTANFISLLQIATLQSSVLLLASLTSGLIGTLGWVASSPFMAENSRPEERTYLFSVNWSIMIIVGVIGSYVGGVLPDLLNGLSGLQTGQQGSAFGYRLALVISVALALAAALPVINWPLLSEKSPLLNGNLVGRYVAFIKHQHQTFQKIGFSQTELSSDFLCSRIHPWFSIVYP